VRRQAIARQEHGHPEVVIKSAANPSGTFVAAVPNGQSVTIVSELAEYFQVALLLNSCANFAIFMSLNVALLIQMENI